jgi:hypothetical protein
MPVLLAAAQSGKVGAIAHQVKRVCRLAHPAYDLAKLAMYGGLATADEMVNTAALPSCRAVSRMVNGRSPVAACRSV